MTCPDLHRTFALMLLPAALLLSACEKVSSPPAFHATEIRDPSFGRELRLPDTEGRVRTLADFRGEVVGVYFGFLQCPDVCPRPCRARWR